MLKIILVVSLIVLNSCSKSEDTKLADLDIDNYLEVLKAKNNKAVLINLWATWCKPCIEEFPLIVKLRNKYKDKIDIVFISLDDDERREGVYDFLNKMNVDWKTYIKTGSDEVLFKFMPDDFSGAIPYTIIKNKENKIVSQFMGKHNFEFFEEKIKMAIK